MSGLQLRKYLIQNVDRVFKKCGKAKSNHVRYSSSLVAKGNYSVKDVEVQTSTSKVAGKLWEGTGCEEPVCEPPILCLHGWLDTCNTFDPLLSRIMRPGRRALAIDLPGHGRTPMSSATGFSNGNLEFMMAIEKVMRHFGWDRVTLLGHSMGSVLSFSFAGVFPEFVTGYIGLDIIRGVPRDHIEMIRRVLEMTIQVEKKMASGKGPPSYSYEEILERSFKGRKESISMEGCKIMLDRGAVLQPDGKYRFSHDLRVTIPTSAPLTDAQSKEIALNIKCPVCIIKGDPGEYYEPKENFYNFVDFMKNNVKEFEFHYIKGTHHFHLNDPEPCVPIVTKFLDTKVSEYVKSITESK